MHSEKGKEEKGDKEERNIKKGMEEKNNLSANVLFDNLYKECLGAKKRLQLAVFASMWIRKLGIVAKN